MSIETLWIADFRCFEETVFEPYPNGLTVLRGWNGAGKTSVLEAVGWLATQSSLRGAPRPALVRDGAARAVLRASTTMGTGSTARRMLVEADVPSSGPTRVQVNRQVVRRRRDLADALRVSVFSPDDLRLVQGGPAERRDYLDDVLVERHPRLEVLVSTVERVVRQRGALLRAAGGRDRAEFETTLDVWDERLARTGSELAEAREALTAELAPMVSTAYARLTAGADAVSLTYQRSWSGSLADALAAGRAEDLRRQSTGVGPHRDELAIALGSRPTRTHASQGEQRGVALALRLGSHELRRRHGAAPVLLLDDVFSELDARRSRALVEQLPPGQVLLTTAVDPPPVVMADRVVEVGAGDIRSVTGSQQERAR